MKWKEQLKGMAAYQPGKSVESVMEMYGLTKIVKMASNENPYGSSPKVKEYLNSVQLHSQVYPDGYATELRQTLSSKLGVRQTQLLFGDGADELISIISRALLRKGVNTIMATPTFVQYRHNAKIEGAEVREVPLKSEEHDLEGMKQQIDKDTSVIWLCSPNNPTGGVIPSNALRAFLDQVPREVLVVLDEAYVHYVDDPDYINTIELLERYENLLLLRTFSKIYGLAAHRVGYAIGHENVIRMLDPVRSPFNVTSLSLGVANVSISDAEFVEKCKRLNSAGKAQFKQYCAERGLHLYDSEANFVLMEIRADSDVIFNELMKRGFIVRSGNALDVPGYIRVTIGTDEQNKEFFLKLDEVFRELGVFV